MKRLSILLPLINLAVFALVAVAFISAHGGWTGDAPCGPAGDTVSEPADKGLVFFNRWNFTPDEESPLTRGFLMINVAPFGVAKVILIVTEALSDEFQTTYPLGLSYASYSLMLGVPLSLLQWFGIGMFLDRFRRRPSVARLAVTLLVVAISTGTASATTSVCGRSSTARMWLRLSVVENAITAGVRVAVVPPGWIALGVQASGQSESDANSVYDYDGGGAVGLEVLPSFGG